MVVVAVVEIMVVVWMAVQMHREVQPPLTEVAAAVQIPEREQVLLFLGIPIRLLFLIPVEVYH
jgi:hypothetical protein